MRDRNGGGGFRPHGGGFTAPVKVGDELDVKIEAVGEKGDGIAKEKGFVLFVPNAKQGDEVRIRVTKVLRKVGFAEVIGASSGAGKTESTSSEEEQKPEEEYSKRVHLIAQMKIPANLKTLKTSVKKNIRKNK